MGEEKNSREDGDVENVYSVKSIPPDKRKPWTYHAVIWAGVCFVLAALMGGATPLSLLPFKYAIMALLIGNLVLLTIFVLTSYMGAKTGLSTYMLAEKAFGKYGARFLINFVASGIPSFAWYGFETWLAAAAIGVLFGWDIGGPNHLMDWRTAAFTLIVGIIMAIPPMRGVTSVALVDFVSIPIMALLTIYGLYLGYELGAAGKLLSYSPNIPPGHLLSNFMIAVHVTIGLIIVGATIAPDTARWIKPIKRNVVLAGLLGFFSVAFFMEIVGAFYAIAAVQAGLDPGLSWNIVLVLKQLGATTHYLFIFLILAFFLQFTTNMANAYSGGLALTATFNKPSWRPWLTLGGAIAGSIIAVAGIIWHWIPYLSTLANWISPVAAVLLTEFYLIRKGFSEAQPPKIRYEALIAWFIGGLVSYYLTMHKPSVVPSLMAIVVSIIIYGGLRIAVERK
jgi:cytosine permease